MPTHPFNQWQQQQFTLLLCNISTHKAFLFTDLNHLLELTLTTPLSLVTAPSSDMLRIDQPKQRQISHPNEPSTMFNHAKRGSVDAVHDNINAVTSQATYGVNMAGQQNVNMVGQPHVAGYQHMPSQHMAFNVGGPNVPRTRQISQDMGAFSPRAQSFAAYPMNGYPMAMAIPEEYPFPQVPFQPLHMPAVPRRHTSPIRMQSMSVLVTSGSPGTLKPSKTRTSLLMRRFSSPAALQTTSRFRSDPSLCTRSGPHWFKSHAHESHGQLNCHARKPHGCHAREPHGYGRSSSRFNVNGPWSCSSHSSTTLACSHGYCHSTIFVHDLLSSWCTIPFDS